MTYDLIIVAASISPELISMTQKAINSCIAEGQVNVILIETSGREFNYKGIDKHIKYEGQFNYNRALNMGLEHRQSEFQILANNDIYFHPGWSRIGQTMRNNGYLSASALSNDFRQKYFLRGDHAYEGYSIGLQIAGWCIFTDNALWEKIGRLDESHRFWFSDNMYVEQLKSAGISHALICNVRIDHLISQTFRRLDYKRKMIYAERERAK